MQPQHEETLWKFMQYNDLVKSWTKFYSLKSGINWLTCSVPKLLDLTPVKAISWIGSIPYIPIGLFIVTLLAVRPQMALKHAR